MATLEWKLFMHDHSDQQNAASIKAFNIHHRRRRQKQASLTHSTNLMRFITDAIIIQRARMLLQQQQHNTSRSLCNCYVIASKQQQQTYQNRLFLSNFLSSETNCDCLEKSSSSSPLMPFLLLLKLSCSEIADGDYFPLKLCARDKWRGEIIHIRLAKKRALNGFRSQKRSRELCAFNQKNCAKSPLAGDLQLSRAIQLAR